MLLGITRNLWPNDDIKYYITNVEIIFFRSTSNQKHLYNQNIRNSFFFFFVLYQLNNLLYENRINTFAMNVYIDHSQDSSYYTESKKFKKIKRFRF